MTTAVSKWIPRKPGGVALKLNPEYVKLWEPYFDEGLSAAHVAEIFGVTKRTVADHYPFRVWNRQQILEHSLAVKAFNKV